MGKKYIKDKTGKFQGSVSDGRNLPASVTLPSPKASLSSVSSVTSDTVTPLYEQYKGKQKKDSALLADAAAELAEIQFYMDQAVETRRYGTVDEVDSWEVNSNDRATAFLDYFVEANDAERFVMNDFLTAEQEAFVLEHADEGYRERFIASKTVSAEDFSTMMEGYDAAHPRNLPSGVVDVDRVEFAEKLAARINADPEGFRTSVLDAPGEKQERLRNYAGSSD